MPGTPDPQPTEVATLLSFVDQQTDGLKNAAFGLTEDQLRATPTVSALSVGGLLKHGIAMHGTWAAILTGPGAGEDHDEGGGQVYRDTFALAPSDTSASLCAALDAATVATAAAAASVGGMDAPITLPEAPWFPAGRTGFTARWVLLHLAEELARHAGQADIIRESVDGATMYELMAGVEGWPATDWLTPWSPPSA